LPEGPEVKRVATGLNDVITGLTITGAEIISGRYTRVGEALGLSALVGCTVTGVRCKGKLIVFDFISGAGNKFSALSTLGMTGFWTPDSRFKYKRLEFKFSDGSQVGYHDPRNFGTFKIVSTEQAQKKLNELGPDILDVQLSNRTELLKQFISRIERYGKNHTLATALLDQRIAAGSGNYIRADAMYLAELSPHLEVHTLDHDRLKRVWTALTEIGEAVELNRYPRLFLLGVSNRLAELSQRVPVFDEYQHLVYYQQTSPFGTPVTSYRDKNKRTVWYAPEEQR